jgi:hypothetical protein
MKRQFITLFFAVLFLILPGWLSAGTLLVNQVTPYDGYGYGLGSWTGMTDDLNTAFGAANITVSGSPLTNLANLLSFDRLWITARQPGDPGLSATEIANVEAFIATGRRVVLIGENNAWTSWNNSILATVGGTYSGSVTNNTLTPALVHPLTAGVNSLNTIADGIAVGGTPLFSQNVATLWGESVVSLLSVNVIDDTTGALPDNPQFKTNLATWLAGSPGAQVPEPGTISLLSLGALVLGSTLRRRKRCTMLQCSSEVR